MVTVSVNINGEKLSSTLTPETILLRSLRDEIRLTGAKNGCSAKHCGACTLFVDGHATKSCLLRAGRLDDAEIVTIEGLSPPGVLHSIQAALLAAGTVQCSFSAAGTIVASKAPLDTDPDPTEADIRDVLKDKVCRHSGHVKIVDAIRLAARWLRDSSEMSPPLGGGYEESVIDLHGVAGFPGRLSFAGGLSLPDVLHAKVLWSEHRDAAIQRMDTSAAERVGAVAPVPTARDLSGRRSFGPLKQDLPVLCGQSVRFVGDAVALMVAGTKAAAARAKAALEHDVLPKAISALALAATPARAVASAICE